MNFFRANITDKKQLFLVYGIAFLFIICNAVFIANEFYYFTIVPIVLLVLIFAFFKLDILIQIVVFCTPLSIPLSELSRNFTFDMYLPTEPLLFGILLLFLAKLIIERKFDKSIAYHPIALAIYFNLIWIFITSMTSTMPVVSFKFFLSRLWYIVAFFFITTQFLKDYKNIKRFLWLYIIPFIIVIAYSIIRHSEHGLLDQQAAHWVMNPFYKDHTSYGSILAMFFPVLLGLYFRSEYSRNLKFFIFLIILLFLFAIVLSYTRATWLSLAGALVVWIVILLRIKLRTILVLSTLAIVLFLIFQNSIIMHLESNKQDSSTNLKEHIQSMSNISSDASNLERINRWKSAIRMFRKKPVLGWGPGTYMFQYAPFQFSYEKTIISTNAGNMGNAHSEYIGPLAESGVLGTVTFLLIIISIINTALRVYHRAEDKEIKMLVMVCLLGLVTYFLHGFLNNFLDTDKASVPFWGFTAIIVALDVYHRQKEKV